MVNQLLRCVGFSDHSVSVGQGVGCGGGVWWVGSVVGRGCGGEGVWWG